MDHITHLVELSPSAPSLRPSTTTTAVIPSSRRKKCPRKRRRREHAAPYVVGNFVHVAGTGDMRPPKIINQEDWWVSPSLVYTPLSSLWSVVTGQSAGVCGKGIKEVEDACQVGCCIPAGTSVFNFRINFISVFISRLANLERFPDVPC